MPDSYNAIPTSNSTYNEKHVASSAGTSLHCPIPCFMRWRRCTECFSWCRLHMPWVAKKGSPQKPENPPAIAPATMSAENIIQPKPDEDHTMATVREVLTLSQSAAAVTPVPFLQEAIGIALKIIQVCEEAQAVEQKVKELQARVGDLMIVIADHVTPKDEEGSKETVVKTAEDIEKDIKELLSILGTINEDLTKIGAENRWVIAAYKQPNMNTLEECMKRLSTARERFTLANDLRDSALISELHARLHKMDNKVDDMHSKVENIHTILFNHKRSGTRPSLARQEMPLKPEIFHGRDDLVQGIARLLLREETSRVCILGPGGMGKSSVSLAVVELPTIKERFPGGNLIWVPCIEATSSTLLLEILYTQLQVPGDKHVTLEKIISELDTPKQPRLILFDNFETPWNAPGGTQKQVSDILRKLAMLNHIAIFLTMRGTYPPCDAIEWQSQTIQPTDEAACSRIFHDINPSSQDDPDVDRLLAALGHMPFAVTLMANLGKRGKFTAQKLLEMWYTSGTDILSVTNSPETNMNRSISLSVDSEFVKKDPDALVLLAILSLLPAGTTKQNLRWWARTVKIISSAIATLSDAGLLAENKRESSSSPVLFVIPVVQSFMQQQGRIAEEIRKQVQSSCCEYILAHACRFDDLTFPKKSKALAAEDTNIQFILFSSPTSQHTPPSESTMEALIAFSWHRCDTKPNLEIANHTVKAARASEVARYIASAVWCLGKAYHHLGDSGPSYDHLQEAYVLFNSLPLGEVELQRLGGLCGIDLVDTAQFELHDKDMIVSLARDVETKCAALSDDVIHGRSLVILGAVLHRAQQLHEALRCLDQARAMLKVAGNTYNVANAYQITSWVHYDEGRLSEALESIEEAWKGAELTENVSIQAEVSLDFGRILFSANRDTEAWKHTEIALMKASYTGNRLLIARALEYMGYGYLRRGDYHNAYGAYEAAAEKYLGTVDARVAERCRENMAGIKFKEENTDMVTGFYRHHLDADQTLFYPSVQASASELPISGS